MLAVQDLEVTYHHVIAAVRGVSLDVADRAVVALLGANGAGKTTLLRAISGMLRSHDAHLMRGTITFEGERIDGLPPSQIVRRGIAQVLEGRRLFAELTVDENLRTGALATSDAAAARRAYNRVLELFAPLRDRRASVAGYLSGGEQQMVAIGRALMASPRLLLLDEPSLGLAPQMVQQIRAIIAEINAGGTAVLLVEQNAQMALSVATHGYVLETGRVALAGQAAELLRDPSVRSFYLGLHEGEGQSSYATLRQRRAERRWEA
ncbi:MAG TPA: ABC transporter ATP-binding protein [Ktedonobacterales bacterium]|nr:ABC transporter ATP-binding protein [Ktedonobacterales bacterium]